MQTVEQKPIATDQGHWYDSLTGEPRYTIIGKNGKERATKITDAKANNYSPSVTTITRDTLPSFGLINWKIDQAIDSALTLPKREGESLDAYKIRVKEDAKAQAEKAASFGSSVHTAIERFMQGKEIDPEYEIYCISALAALEKEIPGFSIEKCEAERSFSHPLRFGGRVDLFSRELGFILDFKTKFFKVDDKVKPYDEQYIQLAAYRMGLGLPEDTKVYNVFISTAEPGVVRIVKHEYDRKWWAIFEHLLATWKLMKEF